MKSVSTGWRGRYEANEVRFDPARITVEEMVARLKQAGTYLKTLE